MICNSFVTIFAAGVMLSSRSAQSYEMVIVARILYGYAAGETCPSMWPNVTTCSLNCD